MLGGNLGSLLYGDVSVMPYVNFNFGGILMVNRPISNNLGFVLSAVGCMWHATSIIRGQL